MNKKLILLITALVPTLAFANGGEMHLSKADINLENTDSLRRGAQLFTNYCLSCHAAGYVRYKRVANDLGVDEKLAVQKLMFVGDFSKKAEGEPKKIGDLMTVAMRSEDAKHWFGTAVPDLSVIARSREADWLYTYLTTFYVDNKRPMGVNNMAFPNVGMPHVLWELDGLKKPIYETEQPKHGETAEHVFTGKFEYVTEGKLSPAKYKEAANDLVNFLVYMGEPGRMDRQRTGVLVIFFLVILLVFAYLMKREFWKDVH
jgi:ubiquinol-cytochrome c reductase cytochrome c1 subunit